VSTWPRISLSTVSAGCGSVKHWIKLTESYWDPTGFEHLRLATDPELWTSEAGFLGRWHILVLILTKGGGVGGITVGDCVELRQADLTLGLRGPRRYLFYALLNSTGISRPTHRPHCEE
jgi:hypothetical protein